MSTHCEGALCTNGDGCECPCGTCINAAVDACQHGAQGYIFHLRPERHAGAIMLEWCPGCGAHRTDRGEWIRANLRGRV